MTHMWLAKKNTSWLFFMIEYRKTDKRGLKMEDLREKYEVVIGLEVHAQLKTKSKIFAPDSTEFGNEQNSQTSAITLGMPGVLPVLNKTLLNRQL